VLESHSRSVGAHDRDPGSERAHDADDETVTLGVLAESGMRLGVSPFDEGRDVVGVELGKLRRGCHAQLFPSG